ncbi:MAG: hypothetical protein ACODTL_01180 [Brucella sp.]
MDLFFLGALGWAPAGGISAGEAFAVSTRIEDGNAASWTRAATPADGLFGEPETERSVGAVIDFLITRYGVDTARLALLGMSLGGYFAARSAAEEPRLAAVVATPVLSNAAELFRNCWGAFHRANAPIKYIGGDNEN